MNPLFGQVYIKSIVVVFIQMNYNYTQNWYYQSELYRILPNILKTNNKYRILEIGSFEGLSACGFSDNFIDHSDSTLDCVDPFIVSGTVPSNTCRCIDTNTKNIFLENIKKSKNYSKITSHFMTSDDFFKTNTKLFDFIYIDGCHEPEFIENDINNSIKFLNDGGIIWMDDYGGNTSNDGKIKIHIDKFLKPHIDKFDIIHKNYQLSIKKIN